MIPQYLYRGDSDKRRIRFLRETIDFYQLQTNLINGGNGREITEKPLLELIDKHVTLGWPKTHFLSFTECERTAFRFGMHCEIEETEDNMLNYSEYFEKEKSWSFAIIKIDTRKIEWKKIDTGIYKGFYSTSLLKFNSNEKYQITFINVHDVLEEHEKYLQSIINSKLDTEWLILPTTVITLNNNSNEYSAIFDGSCISEMKKFKHL